MRRPRVIAIALLLTCSIVWAASSYNVAQVMDGILKTESGGRQFAILDNTTRKSYYLSSQAEAIKMAEYLVSLNHNIDMGLYQINSFHLSRAGWTVARLFDSAFNRQAAETVFSEWLVMAKRRYSDTDLAWERAIGAYNAGTVALKNGNPTYVNKVLRAMGATTPAADRPQPDPRPQGTSSPSASTGIGFDFDEEDEDDLDLIGTPRETQASTAGLQTAVSAVGLLALLLIGIKILGTIFLRLVLRFMAWGTREIIRRGRSAAESM